MRDTGCVLRKMRSKLKGQSSKEGQGQKGGKGWGMEAITIKLRVTSYVLRVEGKKLEAGRELKAERK